MRRFALTVTSLVLELAFAPTAVVGMDPPPLHGTENGASVDASVPTDWFLKTSATSLHARDDHRIAYDSVRGRVVLFGGYYFDGTDHLLRDTWERQGSTWNQATPATRPSAREGHAMAYDAARQRVVMFGGDNLASYFGDTWVWDGSDWTRMTPAASPSARTSPAMAYDAGTQRVVLFGGANATTYLNDTWEWNGSNWTWMTPATSPPPRYAHDMVYDSVRGRVVLYGGYGEFGWLGDTWEWNGSTWIETTPPTGPAPVSGPAMAYDGARQRVVLFGGNDGTYVYDETWEWDGVSWVQVHPVTRPAPRTYDAMTYDTSLQRVVLFGGADNSVGYVDFADTWEYGLSETVGDSGFHDPTDKDRYSWPPQSGVSQYETRRSGSPQFTAPCAGTLTTGTFWDDVEVPLPGSAFFYLNRPYAPVLGSWGRDSAGNERTVCP